MQLFVRTTHHDTIVALRDWNANEIQNDTSALLVIGEASTIPGMTQTLFEVVAAIGLPGIPVGILVSIISSWITSGLEKSSGEGVSDVTLLIRTNEKEIKLDVGQADPASLKILLEQALAS